MGGRASRQKGIRAERKLVEYLRNKEWTEVFRVPLSGAAQGYKGDVIGISPKGEKIVFEVKSRNGQFAKLHGFVDEQGTCGVALDQGLVYMSYDLDHVLYPKEYSFLPMQLIDKKWHRTVKSTMTMFDWLGTADVLAVKDDHRNFIFLRFF